MQNDLQKASLWKRIAAGILDLILIAVLATGFGWMLSSLFGYDSYYNTYVSKNEEYAQIYGVDLEMTEAQFNALSEEERQAYSDRVKQMYAVFNQDKEAVHSYNMILNISLSVVTGSVLLAMLVTEFVVPLLFGNGQTLGKKVFSLCLIRNDGVKLNSVQLFVRAILAKFAVETMIPVYTAVMVLLQIPSGVLLIVVAVLLLAQLIIVAATRNNCLLHDLMAGTVVADYASQKIFKSTDELIAYQKKIAAERAARQSY